MGAFNLLKSSDSGSFSHASEYFSFAGKQLVLEKQLSDQHELKDTYICISYSWGEERIPNPIIEGQEISARTESVLQTVLNGLKHDQDDKQYLSGGLWIDAFCVPKEAAHKQECLNRMGSIYANAAKVLAILSPATTAVLNRVRNNEKINENDLMIIAKDQWASRVWTYQEIVNCRRIYFLAEGENSIPVRGDFLFEAVAKAKSDFERMNNLNTVAMATRYPNLEAFESVILDYRISKYEDRSVFQIISSIQIRRANRSDDVLYAIIGALTSNALLKYDNKVSPAEYIMQIAEAKEDFSFIYTTGKRSTKPGRSWRPDCEQLNVVFAWHGGWGKQQEGELKATHLLLKNMFFMTPGSAVNDNIKGALQYFHAGTIRDHETAYHKLLFSQLKEAGYEGSGKYIEGKEGYFFTYNKDTDLNNTIVAVTTDIRWIFGAPGLMLRKKDNNIYEFVNTGIFLGKIHNQMPAIDLKIG